MTRSARCEGFFRRYECAHVAGTPKHARLRAALLAAIEDGLWAPGERLPDELSLTRSTPFSLGTVQKALRDLASAGVLTRRRGLGTFVATHGPLRATLDTPLHLRFEDGQGGLLPVYPRIVRREPAAGEGPWRQALGSSARVLRIERVYSVADEFRVFTCFHVDGDAYPAFERWPLRRLHARNFKQLLAGEYGARVARLEQRLSAVALPRAVCEAVGAKRGAAGLWLGLTALAAGGRALYYQDAYVPRVNRRLRLPEGAVAL